MKPRILVFASGSAEGGGSGFEELVLNSLFISRKTEVIGVVSNHQDGGVRKRADRLGIPFIHFDAPWTAERYQDITLRSGADLFALSGWLKLIVGLDRRTIFNPKTVINIHPGPLPEFGGKGMYGHHVHEAVIAAFKRGEITHSAVSMHFVTGEFDKGPVFFRLNVPISEDDTPESLGLKVNAQEHEYQSIITDMVAEGLIGWDGINEDSLFYPSGYEIERTL